MKLSSTLDLSGAIDSFVIQPTPSFYESKSATPTTEQLSVCDIFNVQRFAHTTVMVIIFFFFTIVVNYF